MQGLKTIQIAYLTDLDKVDKERRRVRDGKAALKTGSLTEYVKVYDSV